MGLSPLKWLLLLVTFAFLAYKVNDLIRLPPLPKLDSIWWGKGDPWREDKSIRPFKINVSNEVLLDLRHRLKHTKPFTLPLEGIQHQYGMNTDLLEEILDYWLTNYDWRKQEKFLNSYPQFITSIQGLDIHYIHVKPNVIVASLPGYGFSDAAVKPGLGAAQAAVLFRNFMKRLGFQRFYGQGGDFGGIILQNLAVLFPEAVLGYHSNMCMVYTPLSMLKSFLGVIYPTWFVKEEHIDRVYPLWDRFVELLSEVGHIHIQATKPDTVGVALKDSPAGLAAYILEKFVSGTNLTYQQRKDGGLKQTFGYDKLLDNVMIYWITGSITTSARLYAETYNRNHMSLGIANHPVTVPSSCARFSNDIYAADGFLSEIYPNLVHLSDYEGGHFAALQLPQVLADDIFEAVGKMRRIN